MDKKELTICQKLKAKTATERADIKGVEIAKAVSLDTAVYHKEIQRSKYKIEIVDIHEIKGGVEVFVRAWDKKGQIGFGKDGSVDIERMRIFNPPVLVEDPNGNVEIARHDIRTNKQVIEKLREDPTEALLRDIEHTLSIKKEIFDDSKIVKGKVGKTTSTFYPTSDGSAERNAGSGVDWSVLIGGNGTTNVSYLTCTYYQTTATTNKFDRNWRGQLKFDTSAIGTDEISSAVISLYGDFKQFSGTGTKPDTNIYEGTTSALANSDYENTNNFRTAFSTAIGYDDFSTAGYNNFTLNSSGIAKINGGGTSGFSVKNANFDVAETQATWESNTQIGIAAYGSAEAGTTKDPKLVVEHEAGGATFQPGAMMQHLQIAGGLV